jgi:hypothetical protein
MAHNVPMVTTFGQPAQMCRNEAWEWRKRLTLPNGGQASYRRAQRKEACVMCSLAVHHFLFLIICLYYFLYVYIFITETYITFFIF